MFSQPKAPAKSQPQAPPPKIKILTTEQALQQAGNGHRYQSRTICLMFFQILLSSFILVNNAFFFPEVDFYCVHSITDDQGITNVSEITFSSIDYCPNQNILLNQTDPMNNYTCSIEILMTKSVTSSYSLYCDREVIREWIGYYMRIVCWTAGFMIFAKLQNNYSRVKLIRSGLVLLALIAILLFFSFTLAIF